RAPLPRRDEPDHLPVAPNSSLSLRLRVESDFASASRRPAPLIIVMRDDTSLLRDAEPVYMDFELVIDANAVDAVRLDFASWLRVDHRAVDDVLHFITAYPHFQRVRRLAALVRLLHRIIGCLRRDIRSGVAVALLDQPRPILPDYKIGIALLSALQRAAAKDKP